MSFSYDIKKEIASQRMTKKNGRTALGYGLCLFGRGFSEEEVSLRTEHEVVAQLYARVAGGLPGRETAVRTRRQIRSGREIFTVFIPEADDRKRLLARIPSGGTISREVLTGEADIHAFLAGAFLSCGNASDPAKSYHLEFVTRSEALCEDLARLLDECIPGAKVSGRRGQYVVYYKECAQIEDLLTLLGASRASLAMIDVEMIKNVRNRANRVTNCETANIDKLVGAASVQIEDIRLIIDTLGETALPEHLLETALLRLDNPDASLRELVELSRSEVSRSGMHHRLAAISKIARELRAGGSG